MDLSRFADRKSYFIYLKQSASTVNLFIYLRCKHLVFNYKILIMTACTVTGCGEVTKLIPAAPPGASPGFETRDFSSTNDGRSLAGDPLLGLEPALAESRTSFEQLGEEQLAQEILGMSGLAKELTAALRSGQFQGSLRSVTAPPQASSAALRGSLSEWQKTKVRTNVFTVLTNPEPALLTARRIWPAEYENALPAGLAVLRTPNSVFRGLARDFDPRRLTASEAGIGAAEPRPESGLNWQKTAHRTLYGRSLQPGNEYQVAVQCSQVTFAGPGGTPLVATWPRIVIRESNGRPESQSPDKKEIRAIFRLNLVYVDSDESGRPATLDAGPISHDLFITRTASTASIRSQAFVYDGAQSGVSYALFHEARDLFLMRFASSRRTSREIKHLWTSYRIPFARLIVGITEQRSDVGLSRRLFADNQTAHLAAREGFDAPQNFPTDKWVRLDQLKAYNDRLQPVPPSAVASSEGYGVHVLDPETLSAAQNFSYFFKDLDATTPGTETADRHVLDKDDYPLMVSFCKSLF